MAVGGPVGARLLDTKPVIAVSATLGGAPPFPGFAFAMGFDPAAAPGTWGEKNDDGERDSQTGRGYVPLQTPSSFDWKEQGLLYVGKDLPDPGRARDAWIEQAGDRLCRLVNAAGGRALVLCTSHANVRTFADLLRERTTHDVLAQGDADVGRLTRSFVEDEASVLVGTRSFWQGIDAPGVSCVLVVIDRIPFPSPGEPLHAARRGPRNRARAERVRDRRPSGRRARARAGRRPADPHAQRPRCRRGARLAPRAIKDYRHQLLDRDPAVAAQRRPRRGVRVPRGRGRERAGVDLALVGAAAGGTFGRRTSSRFATRSPARSAARKPAIGATMTTASSMAFLHDARIAAMPDA